jgi:hypothetical protein
VVGDAIVAVGVAVVVASALGAGDEVVGVAAGVGVGALVVVGAGAEVAVLVLDPAKGSVYCWSPADPPPAARVTAGKASRIAPSTNRPFANHLVSNTLRV